MIRTAAMLLLAAIVGVPPVQAAAVDEESPYYLCFAYTQDGMMFAGGDFNLERAQTLMATNCNMPKSLTVVLLKTIMVRKNGKIHRYAVRE